MQASTINQTQIPRTLILRKSHGPFSAGTVVKIVEQPGKTRDEYTVEAEYTKVSYFTDLDGRRKANHTKVTEEFTVSADDIVELRSRSDIVPAVPRIDRPARKAKRILYEMRHKQGV